MGPALAAGAVFVCGEMGHGRGLMFLPHAVPTSESNTRCT